MSDDRGLVARNCYFAEKIETISSARAKCNSCARCARRMGGSFVNITFHSLSSKIRQSDTKKITEISRYYSKDSLYLRGIFYKVSPVVGVTPRAIISTIIQYFIGYFIFES